MLARLLFLLSMAVAALAQTSAPSGNDPNYPAIASDSVQYDDHTTGVSINQDQINALNSIQSFVMLKLGTAGFDYLFGTFPGAENILTMQASGAPYPYNPQIMQDGTVYTSLPTDAADGITVSLPNYPYEFTSTNLGGLTVTTGTTISNPSHSFFQTQLKINQGKMNGFVYAGDSKATIAMGYYDLSSKANTGLWNVAKQYTLFDHHFSSTFGDSVIAHLYVVGGKSVPFDSSMTGQCPSSVVDGYSASAFMQTSLQVGPDGNTYYFPTDYSQQPPLTRDCIFVGELNAASLCTGSGLVLPAIPSTPASPGHFGDVMEKYGKTWAYYSEDFVDAEAAQCHQSGPRQFNVHEEPFPHYAQFDQPFSNTSDYWITHNKDARNFWDAMTAGSLENIAWFNAAQTHDYGLSNGSPDAGNAFIDAWMANLTANTAWQQGKVLVMITTNAASGSFDHVPPYKGDRYGPGLRLPMILVSPYHKATGGKVNKDPYEIYSFMKMVARRFGVSDDDMKALWGTPRFMAARDLTASFPTTGGGNNGAVSFSGSGAGLAAVVFAVLAMLA